MKKILTISYQNRYGVRGSLPIAPKIVLANHIIEKICNFSIGEKLLIEYSKNQIIIKKLT